MSLSSPADGNYSNQKKILQNQESLLNKQPSSSAAASAQRGGGGGDSILVPAQESEDFPEWEGYLANEENFKKAVRHAQNHSAVHVIYQVAQVSFNSEVGPRDAKKEKI